MRPGSDRWHVVSESEFAHEREGLDHVRDLLPERAPFHAWSNFEFRDSQGKWHEVDLLVLGEGRFHLVELKHYREPVGGTAYRWRRGRRSEDSPLILARRKAQRLKSVLVAAAQALDPNAPTNIPYVQECVFLHAQSSRCLLPGPDRTDLFGLVGMEPTSNLPGIADRLLEPARQGGRSRVSQLDLVRVVETAGFAVRREREVGSWRLLGEPVAEGEAWQDWPAEHKVARTSARIRFQVGTPGEPDSAREGRRHLAEREFQLTRRLEHAGVLRPVDLVDADLGVGLVFPYDKDASRLDLWLADSVSGRSVRTQVDLIRQLAEALQYAHGNRVVHRALNPIAVSVTETAAGAVRAVVGGWAVAGETAESDSRAPSAPGTATRVQELLSARADDPAARAAGGFVAPEGRWLPGAADRVRLDVFALGAVAYHLVAGRPPAANAAELRERVSNDDGLDLVGDVPEVPATLRDLVLDATRPRVSARLRDMGAFLEKLSEVDKELGARDAGELDPLEAAPGTLLGDRFELVRRLGSGSTAVGLLVKDRQAGDVDRVLKVAIDDAAEGRLRGEAEVLQTLGQAKHPRLVRLVEAEPLRVGERLALVVESAGKETLSDVLRGRPRLSLDLLDRWGTDLLEALVALDEAGIDHRDIKPANLGVRKQPSDRAEHLVLFDFSLSKAGAASIGAGTPPYLDPYLGSGTRTHWDSAAERYAAAVTLFEMATGRAPVYGDGMSDPAAIADEATVEPGDFDPTLADGLVLFFRKALASNARKRHHTASEMLAAWRATMSRVHTTVPDDGNALAERATAATLLPDSGLTARALSALEPFHLQTVGDLLRLEPGRVTQLKKVALVTRSEINARRKEWQARLGADPAEAEAPAIEVTFDSGADPLADPAFTATALVNAAGIKRARRKAALVLLGLDGNVAAFATQAEFASQLGVSGPPPVSAAFESIREAWASHESASEILDRIAAEAVGALRDLDGVAWVDEVVDTLLARPGVDDDVRQDPRLRRIVAGLVRAALDGADDRAKAEEADPRVARRRRRSDNRVLLARSASLAEAGTLLGERADELLVEAADRGEVVVPLGRAADRMRPDWPDGVTPPEDARLVRLAARLSGRAAASATGELYDPDMAVADAVRLAVKVAEDQKLTVQQIQERVRGRFPKVQALPGRPGLDGLLRQAGTGLEWTGDRYAVPSSPSDTTFATRATVIPTGRPHLVDDVPEAAALRRSVVARSFLALGVPARSIDRRLHDLVEGFGAGRLDVTEVLLAALREEAERSGVPWAQVTAADAADAASTPARGLAELVRRAVPVVERAIDEAMADAPAGTRPVVLTDAAPLARYGHLGVVAQLADITTSRRQPVWLLVPLEPDRAPTLDGAPLPLSYASQFLVLDRDLVTTAPEGMS